MRVPDWRHTVFLEGVLPEPITNDSSRLVVWLAEGGDGAFRYWERAGSVAGAEVVVKEGLCAAAATATAARQRVQGRLGKWLQTIRGAHSDRDRNWILPNGELAEPCGEKASDLLLVWPEDQERTIDEELIRSRWPAATRVRRLGPKLFLVTQASGKARSEALAAQPGTSEAEAPPAAAAESLLIEARRRGEPRGLAAALTDLGLIRIESGDTGGAVALLEEALSLVEGLDDRLRKCDVLGNLGMAYVAIGQARRGQAFIERELTYARELRDRFAEKLALEHQAHAWAGLGEPVRAQATLGEAVKLARLVGDQPHEARLLWLLAIQQALVGQRSQAVALAGAAVRTLSAHSRPEAAWYDEHLKQYRNGAPAAALSDAGSAGQGGGGDRFGGSISIDVRPGADPARRPAPAATDADPARDGVRILVIAITATKAMVRFLGSALKTIPHAAHRERVATCEACEHYTGLRCRVCGCFIQAKARMAHEQCPLGKWPVYHQVRK